MGAVILILVVVLGVLALKRLGRPHTEIELARGAATVLRGAPPSALVSDLSEIARAAPRASGRVRFTGRGANLEVEVLGLDDGVAQRVRNAVGLHRARIR